MGSERLNERRTVSKPLERSRRFAAIAENDNRNVDEIAHAAALVVAIALGAYGGCHAEYRVFLRVRRLRRLGSGSRALRDPAARRLSLAHGRHRSSAGALDGRTDRAARS